MNVNVVERIYLMSGILAVILFVYSIFAMDALLMIAAAVLGVMALVFYFGLFRCPFCRKHLGKRKDDSCPHCGKIIR